MNIQLLLQRGNTITPLPFCVGKMINAGFTGRNQEEVRHHLDELAAKGIEVPVETPVLYPVIPGTITAGQAVNVYGRETSGEIEYVLFVVNPKEIYVGIGSDHTDRHLEEVDIPRAKQITPNVVSPLVWPLDEVEEHWDDLVMECTVQTGDESLLYQKGRLELLMSPAELMELVSNRVTGTLDNSVIFSGTVKMETDDFVFADTFTGLLSDPVLNREIGFTYTINPLDYLD